MEYLARVITEIVFLAKEVLATWVTDGLELTPRSQDLFHQLGSTLGDLADQVTVVIADFIANLLSLPASPPI